MEKDLEFIVKCNRVKDDYNEVLDSLITNVQFLRMTCRKAFDSIESEENLKEWEQTSLGALDAGLRETLDFVRQLLDTYKDKE